MKKFLALFVVPGIIFSAILVSTSALAKPAATHSYIPALAEFALTLGLVLCIVFCYRAAVHWLPILPPPHCAPKLILTHNHPYFIVCPTQSKFLAPHEALDSVNPYFQNALVEGITVSLDESNNNYVTIAPGTLPRL